VLGVKVHSDDSKVSSKNIKTEIRLRFERDLIKNRLENGELDWTLRGVRYDRVKRRMVI
jgi:hypothetical protein